jgi:hypothetical protein
LMKADQPNESAILASIDKVAQARAELEKATARFLLALRGQLTADQWKQLQTMHANRTQHGPQRSGWGQRGGPRPGMNRQGGQFRRQQGPPPQPSTTPPANGAQPSGAGVQQ